MFSCFLIEDWSKTGLSLGTTAETGKSTYMLQCTVSLKCCTQKNTWHQIVLPKKIPDLNISTLIYSISLMT